MMTSTYFYPTLIEKGVHAVDRWFVDDDLFNKKYIMVPIISDNHWSLAVIINPGKTDDDCALFRMELHALLERLKLLKEQKEATDSNINSPTLTASDSDGAEFHLEHGAYVSITERNTHIYEMMKN
jgi:Ulp1 family protease